MTESAFKSYRYIAKTTMPVRHLQMLPVCKRNESWLLDGYSVFT